MVLHTPSLCYLLALVPLLLSSVVAYPSGDLSAYLSKRQVSNKGSKYNITIVNRYNDYKKDEDKGPVQFLHSREDYIVPSLSLEYQAEIVNDDGDAKYLLMKADGNTVEGQKLEKGEFRVMWPGYTHCHFEVDKAKGVKLGHAQFAFQSQLGDRSWLSPCSWSNGFQVVCRNEDGSGASCKDWSAPIDPPDHTFYVDIRNTKTTYEHVNSTHFFDSSARSQPPPNFIEPDEGSVYFYFDASFKGSSKLPFDSLKYRGVIDKKGKTTFSLVDHNAIPKTILDPQKAYGEKEVAKFDMYMRPDPAQPAITVPCELKVDSKLPPPPRNSVMRINFQPNPADFVRFAATRQVAGNVRISCKIGDATVISDASVL